MVSRKIEGLAEMLGDEQRVPEDYRKLIADMLKGYAEQVRSMELYGVPLGCADIRAKRRRRDGLEGAA